MTWVKVCGLSDIAGVEAAVQAGADALGFVLAKSPRQVTPQAAADLGRGQPAKRVIVTVDALPEDLLAMAEEAGADGVQPHGLHAADAGAAAIEVGLVVLRPIAVVTQVDMSHIALDQIPLLDSYDPNSHGGTGRVLPWDKIDGAGRLFVLAGGLDPDNVESAVRLARPWGVDASSGLESSPGVKDPKLISRFVERAKSL